MINWIMKKSGDIALKTDVGKLDLSRLPEEVTEIKDVSYVDDNEPGHKLDIFVRMDGTKKPVLIDIHGGGFISEDKAMNRLFGNYMAKLGFVEFFLGSLVFRAIRWNIARFVGLSFIRAHHGKKSSQALESRSVDR